jgi:hypothetical protein
LSGVAFGQGGNAHTLKEDPVSTTEVIIFASVAVVLLVALAWWATTLHRRHELQDRFGGEYEVVIEEHGTKREADRELKARQERHEQLDIRTLDPQRRRYYAEQWRAAQARFVDEPQAAFEESDRLVADVMGERGYPVGDVDRQMADLSVEHSDVLNHYREAHEIAEASADGRTTTEDLRRGMVHYGALFSALLEDHAETPTTGR